MAKNEGANKAPGAAKKNEQPVANATQTTAQNVTQNDELQNAGVVGQTGNQQGGNVAQSDDKKLKFKRIVVKTPGGFEHRFYSLEDHGKDFENLAKEFCEGHEGFTYEPVEEKKIVVPTAEEIAKVDVFDKWGGIHRTYSMQEHGEEYKSLAEEFCKTNKGFTFKVRN